MKNAGKNKGETHSDKTHAKEKVSEKTCTPNAPHALGVKLCYKPDVKLHREDWEGMQVAQAVGDRFEKRLAQKTGKSGQTLSRGLKQAFHRPLGSQESAVPNEALRSSLFGILCKGKRIQVKDKIMYSCGSTSVSLTGELLGQGDLDVFMAALRRVYDSGSFGSACSIYWIQKALGLSPGKSSSDRIRESIDRMIAATIKIDTKKTHYSGHLIEEFEFDKETQKYRIRFNPMIVSLFRDGYARINLSDRRELKGDLTKFLHGLAASHEAPYDRPQKYSLGKLGRLCNSLDTNERRFRAKVKGSMGKLKEKKIIRDWGLDDNILWFTKT